VFQLTGDMGCEAAQGIAQLLADRLVLQFAVLVEHLVGARHQQPTALPLPCAERLEHRQPAVLGEDRAEATR